MVYSVGAVVEREGLEEAGKDLKDLKDLGVTQARKATKATQVLGMTSSVRPLMTSRSEPKRSPLTNRKTTALIL